MAQALHIGLSSVPPKLMSTGNSECVLIRKQGPHRCNYLREGHTGVERALTSVFSDSETQTQREKAGTVEEIGLM